MSEPIPAAAADILVSRGSPKRLACLISCQTELFLPQDFFPLFPALGFAPPFPARFTIAVCGGSVTEDVDTATEWGWCGMSS